jgi:hypothetical protein
VLAPARGPTGDALSLVVTLVPVDRGALCRKHFVLVIYYYDCRVLSHASFIIILTTLTLRLRVQKTALTNTEPLLLRFPIA